MGQFFKRLYKIYELTDEQSTLQAAMLEDKKIDKSSKNQNANGNGGKTGNGKPGNEDKKKNDKGGVEKKEGGDGGGGDVEFTADEDAKLLEMKAANKTWREIATEMKKPQQALKNRFKEIKPADGGGEGERKKHESKKDESKKDEPKKDEPKKDEAKKDEAKRDQEKGWVKKHKGEAKANEGKKREKEKKEERKVKSSGSSNGEAKFSMSEWLTLQEDKFFSFGELQCLSELLVRDRDRCWERLASAFLDRTGRRVHPEDIREKFEEMAKAM